MDSGSNIQSHQYLRTRGGSQRYKEYREIEAPMDMGQLQQTIVKTIKGKIKMEGYSSPIPLKINARVMIPSNYIGKSRS